MGADRKIFPSQYEDQKDWIRWQFSDDHLYEDLSRQIPISIKSHLTRDIHHFGKDTPALLGYVYTTKPMLNAAPSEPLDFSLVAHKQKIEDVKVSTKVAQLSNRKKRKLKERVRQLKETIASKRAEGGFRLRKLVESRIKPRYDEVYFEGLDWLENRAGETLPDGEFGISFSREVTS